MAEKIRKDQKQLSPAKPDKAASGKTTQKREKTAVAYQNKDITSKFLAENFKGKTFNVYGLDLPRVERVLPTNIPTIQANELRLDNLFELADNTVALVDYESEYDQQDKVKYLNYVTGIANRYQRDGRNCPIIRMIVIYTGDISRQQVSAMYDIGTVKMQIKTAFLSDLNSEEIFRHLKAKVEQNQTLSDEELMQFIILPLSYRKKEEKQQKIHDAVALAAAIQDRKQQLFALTGILVFTDKIIDRETADRIRRTIEMTQVAQIFEEEKRQAIAQMQQLFEEEKRQAEKEHRQSLAQIKEQNRQSLAQIEEQNRQSLAQVKEQNRQSLAQIKEQNRQSLAQIEEQKRQAEEKNRQIVINMLKKNYPMQEILSLVSGYSPDDIEQLRKESL